MEARATAMVEAGVDQTVGGWVAVARREADAPVDAEATVAAGETKGGDTLSWTSRSMCLVEH